MKAELLGEQRKTFVDQKATLGFTFRARIIKLRGCNFNFNVDSNNYEFYGIFECIILCHV